MSEPRTATAFSRRIPTRAFIVSVFIWAIMTMFAGEFLGFGILAILWLMVLILWGVFSPSFKPYPDEPRLPPGSES